jgi:rhamnose utilization protein RhaD (predicted bifunctional aldolase and dehydrogenase)
MSLLPPEDLNFYSAKIGSSASLVQGPGGNTSCKEGSNVWVKSSGKWLAKAEDENIFCCVSPNAPKINLIGDSSLRPSIETYFHTLLPMKAIFHVHSLGSLTWAIRENGRELLSSYFPELLWILYKKPGRELAEVLAESFKGTTAAGAILQNHGMVIWGETLEECYERLIDYEERLLAFATAMANGQERHNIEIADLQNEPYLTPDHAVFSSDGATIQKDWQWEVLEILQAAIKLVPITTSLNFLSQESVRELVIWDEEIFRKQTNA